MTEQVNKTTKPMPGTGDIKDFAKRSGRLELVHVCASCHHLMIDDECVDCVDADSIPYTIDYSLDKVFIGDIR